MSGRTTASQQTLRDNHSMVERSLRMYGTKHVAVRLKVSEGAVRYYARKHNLAVLSRIGYVRINTAAAMAGVEPTTAQARAKRDGVLKTRPSKVLVRNPRWVPLKWAEGLADEYEAQRRNNELVMEANWLNISEAARLLGVSPNTVRRALDGEGFLAKDLGDAIVHEGTTLRHSSRSILLDPRIVNAVRVKLEKRARRLEAHWSRKRLALELGWTPKRVTWRLKKLGITGEVANTGKVWQRVYPPGSLELLKEHYPDDEP